MLNRTRMLMHACLAAALVLGAGAAYGDTLPAVWQAKQAKFHFFGLTSKYTCDGLKSKVKLLLRTLGARDDVKVEGGCSGLSFNAPQDSQSVVIGFAIPVPAEGWGSPGETFPAEWREVRLQSNKPRNLAWGDCELVEQLNKQVLTLFNARDVKDNTTCTPHQVNIGDPDLRLTLLMPVPAAPTANPPSPAH